MSLLTPHLGFFVWTLVAFIVVLLLLRKFAWKPILKSLNERESNIANSIAAAEKVRAEMSQMKSENEALLAKAREERTAMLKEAREIRDKIISDAKEQSKVEAGKILSDAQAAINVQKMAALTDLKNQVGKLVIEISEKVLRKELGNQSSQEAFIREMVDEVKLN
ncbi:MAG TPA: F0F1 ATP synthase subunit B [Chitinophagaceae bacterium]|nr:F0F1 ATP synthase subunit B [Chitinophagaceae bacterium]